MSAKKSLICLGLAAGAAALVPRNVRIDGKQFVLSETGEPVVLAGPNVVIKGPPYLPTTDGNTACFDLVDDDCAAAGTCQTCLTFNEADVNNLKARGWNAIRLSVVWAGAQVRRVVTLTRSMSSHLVERETLITKAGVQLFI